VKIIAITSGKGGVGKSTIAANVAWHLASFGYRTILVDGDLGMANLDIILGVRPKRTILDLLRGEAEFGEVLEDVAPNLKLLAGESGDEIVEFGVGEVMERLFGGLAQLEDADYVLIDTGAGIAEGVRSFVQAANEAMVVTMPDPAAIMDAYAMIKYCHKVGRRVDLVVNRVRDQKEALEIAGKLEDVVHRHVGRAKMELAGFVERSALVEECARQRVLLSRKFPGSVVASRYKSIAKKIAGGVDKRGEPIPESSKAALFFKRLLQQI